MSASVAKTWEVAADLGSACARLVRPEIADRAERACQARLIAGGLFMPFVLGGAAALTLPPHLGFAATLATVSGIFGLSWFLAMLVAASGKTALPGFALLALGTATVASVIAAGGGPASPLALLAAALFVEPWHALRSRSALGTGAAAAVLALVAANGLAGLLPAHDPQAVNALHWLPAAAWAGLAMLRGSRPPEVAEPADSAPVDLAIEEVSDGVFLRLTPAGDVATATGTTSERLGLAPQFLIGTALIERVHLADRVAYLSALSDLRHEPGRRSIEMRLRLPAADAARNADGFRVFRAAMSRRAGDDAVSMLLQTSGELASLRAELADVRERAEATETTKSRFLAAVSHELRTPLNAIIGFSDMLVHEMFGPFHDPRQKEYAGLIRDSGAHLLSVVNAILDVSKIEAGTYPIQCESFDFADAARMSLSMLQLQAAEKSIDLDNEVAGAIGQLVGDRRAVQQILINLVSNAVKFTPEGGRVSLGARRSGERLSFWVSDTGIGIPESDLGRIGQPFMQVQNDYTRNFVGTGLGLSLVKGLVKLHQGTMTIESAPGLGTTVAISVPLAGPSGDSGVVVLEPSARSSAKEAADEPLRKTA